MKPNPVRSVTTRLLGSTALVVGVVTAMVALPAAVATPVAAQERVEVSVEFREALAPHGKWQRHSRWGEVWVPANVGRDWRPYTRGRWVYTDDYGWYWTAVDEEAAWGLVVYHYGRWVDDGDAGWVWVPGREWGPAWVDWRRGDKAVGWAPLPPDEIVVEVRERPSYWVFVRPRDLVAERVTTVLLPPRERDVYIRETVIVNRTVIVSDRGPRFAVNPGIPPAYIAAAYGRPIRTWSVQPRVLVGTGRIPGAVEIQVNDLRDRRSRAVRETSYLRQTRTAIQPARDVPAPQALTGDQGRLGDNPPRAARQAAPGDAPTGTDARRPDGTAPADTATGGTTPGQATGARDGERAPTTGERRDQTPATREGSRPADRDDTRRQGAAPADRDDARRQGTERREERRDERRERQGRSERDAPGDRGDRTGRGERTGQERGPDRCALARIVRPPPSGRARVAAAEPSVAARRRATHSAVRPGGPAGPIARVPSVRAPTGRVPPRDAAAPTRRRPAAAAVTIAVRAPRHRPASRPAAALRQARDPEALVAVAAPRRVAAEARAERAAARADRPEAEPERTGPRAMPGKRVQLDDETFEALALLARDSMKDFQELADEAFADLLKKHHRPVGLKDALRQSLRRAPANDRPARPAPTPAPNPAGDAAPGRARKSLRRGAARRN